MISSYDVFILHLYIDFCVLFYILQGSTLNEESVSLINDITSTTNITISGELTRGIYDGKLMYMSYFILIACTILLGHLYLIEVVIEVVEIMIIIIMTIIICVNEVDSYRDIISYMFFIYVLFEREVILTSPNTIKNKCVDKCYLKKHSFLYK